MALELDRDITINGHTFKKGKDVDTKVTDTVDGKAVSVDYADGIKEQLLAAQKNDAAVAAEVLRDPLEATKKLASADTETTSTPVTSKGGK